MPEPPPIKPPALPRFCGKWPPVGRFQFGPPRTPGLKPPPGNPNLAVLCPQKRGPKPVDLSTGRPRIIVPDFFVTIWLEDPFLGLVAIFGGPPGPLVLATPGWGVGEGVLDRMGPFVAKFGGWGPFDG